MTVREGGCLCGEVRYRFDAEPADIAYCHCRMCQRSAGAPAMVWFTIPTASLAWTLGRPVAYRSSEGAGRLFCGACGGQLAFKVLATPERIDLTAASLDDPAALRPEYHIWTSSRLPWFDTADSLPRHKDERATAR